MSIEAVLVQEGSKFEETDEKNAWDKVMDLNLKGTFFTIQKFTPLLTKAATTQDPSRVIAIGSVAGIVTGETGETNAWSYAASKAAVLHLVRYLAVELRPRHVLVNGIAPGVMVTKMTRALMGGAAGEEALAKKHPNGRMGKPEDIAAAVVYLSSRAGGHINGHTIVVDGGKIHARNNL